MLLKNDGLLPLNKNKLRSVAVIGANATSTAVLHGNYNGYPSKEVTFFQGIKAELGDRVLVTNVAGCPLALHPGQKFGPDLPEFQQALSAARQADVIIYVGGISPLLEGEEMKVNDVGFLGGDRTQIELPAQQTELLKALQATGKPVVFVNCSGGAVAFPWEADHLPAILQAWYPGQAGGTALAEVLLGDCNPSGRLPVTFYDSTQDLPPFEDYSMKNRTYRYFTGKPLYPFGHGLSYTRFDYSGLNVSAQTVKADDTVRVSMNLKNSGPRDGDEVVQLYVRHLDSKVPQPIHSLAAFKRVSLAHDQSERVELKFTVGALRNWEESAKRYVVEPGAFEIQIGGSSTDIRATAKMEVIP